MHQRDVTLCATLAALLAALALISLVVGQAGLTPGEALRALFDARVTVYVVGVGGVSGVSINEPRPPPL